MVKEIFSFTLLYDESKKEKNYHVQEDASNLDNLNDLMALEHYLSEKLEDVINTRKDIMISTFFELEDGKKG